MHSQSFPTEILAEIFSHCTVDTGLDTDYPFEPHDIILNQAPHSLTRVSSRWRSITLTSPRLWTSLSLPLLPRTPESIELFLAELQLWLARSEMLPLSFRVHFSAYDVLGSQEQTSLQQVRPYIIRYMQILSQHSHRWLDVCSNLKYARASSDVHPFPGLSTTPLLRSFALCAPTLHTLSLGNPNPVVIPDQPIVSYFRPENAPHLRQIILDHPSLARCVLPWIQLTKLHMAKGNYPDAQGFMRNLKACTNLEELHISFGTARGIPMNSDQRDTIVLPSLRRLDVDLSTTSNTMFHFFFDTLQTPRLESLALTTGYYLDMAYPEVGGPFRTYRIEQLHDAFKKFMGQCGESLKELEMVDPVETIRVLVDVLRKLENLEVLDVHSQALAPSILEALTSRTPNEPTGVGSPTPVPILRSGVGEFALLPSLGELRCQGVPFDLFGSDPVGGAPFFNNLGKFVECRSASRAALDLEAFKVRLGGRLRERMREDCAKVYERLEALRGEGKLCLESM
ncbi:uncharacterized protein STEHIDRAFT_170801 [Stereum hirsutum FP-91666 SS1]|uniref:uncharacterized protein n=1 Tax=Stereum hirsutum (strain FP-91666) TaxID=721885 RepID=UPI0004449250|nr:uncharacterized protein STEHIDRAFT_170801 [Stereum hirsutum FP-91666 SS1]EIM83550.1 hypothetical protein STEHIDRAFT_170801 [Stereum hirsutum FP-91666 SS1]